MKIRIAALCASLLSLPVMAMPNLMGTDWDLKQPAAQGRPPSLSFQARGIAGFAGCNRYMGIANEQGNLRMVTTRMLCAPEVMKAEQAFVAFLSQPFQIEVDDIVQKLVLSSALGRYQFVRQAPAVPARRGEVPLAISQQPVYLHVAAERKACQGVAPMQCLQIRPDERAPWTLFYGEIEGLDLKPGTAYYVKVRYQKVDNPPADAPSVRTILDRVVFSETVSR